MSLIMMALPKTTMGILMARPNMSKVVLPFAAAATAMTLSKLMTKSAIRMVLIATIKLAFSTSPSS